MGEGQHRHFRYVPRLWSTKAGVEGAEAVAASDEGQGAAKSKAAGQKGGGKSGGKGANKKKAAAVPAEDTPVAELRAVSKQAANPSEEMKRRSML